MTSSPCKDIPLAEILSQFSSIYAPSWEVTRQRLLNSYIGNLTVQNLYKDWLNDRTFREPVTLSVNDRVVLNGHHRIITALEYGIKCLPVQYVDTVNTQTVDEGTEYSYTVLTFPVSGVSYGETGSQALEDYARNNQEPNSDSKNLLLISFLMDYCMSMRLSSSSWFSTDSVAYLDGCVEVVLGDSDTELDTASYETLAEDIVDCLKEAGFTVRKYGVQTFTD